MDIAQKIINLRVPEGIPQYLNWYQTSDFIPFHVKWCSDFIPFFNKTNLRIHSFLLTMVHGKNKIPVGGIELC